MSDLSGPTVHAIAPERLASLRRRAALVLTGGAAANDAALLATDALTVLHTLASSPDTASDALTLLHELQVHQVELDLQAQELQESRAEIETALRRQIELYDGQPAGCLTLDGQLQLHELNLTGADMLGLVREDALGLSLESFVSAESAARLRAAIAAVDAGQRRASCQLRLRRLAGAYYPVIASVGRDLAANRYLVNWMDATDDR